MLSLRFVQALIASCVTAVGVSHPFNGHFRGVAILKILKVGVLLTLLGRLLFVDGVKEGGSLDFGVEVRWVRGLGLETGLGLAHVGVFINFKVLMILADFRYDAQGCGSEIVALFGGVEGLMSHV